MRYQPMSIFIIPIREQLEERILMRDLRDSKHVNVALMALTKQIVSLILLQV